MSCRKCGSNKEESGICPECGNGVNALLGEAREINDGQPCSHRGCLNHLSHPCEGCGRIGGKGKAIDFKRR